MIKYIFWVAAGTFSENLFWTFLSKEGGVETWEWRPYTDGVGEVNPQHLGKEESVYYYAYGYTSE